MLLLLLEKVRRFFIFRDMKLKVNGEMVEHDVAYLSQLLETMALPERGVAVAVNNTMISREEWKNYSLSEGDNILIIKAACGG